MLEQEVKEIIEILAVNFNIEVEVKFNSRRKRGGCIKNIIKLPYFKNRHKKSLLPYEDLILHEFSHALGWVRFGEETRHHNGFYYLLKEVVKSWYGNLENYKWSVDYASIYGLYQKEIGVQC